MTLKSIRILTIGFVGACLVASPAFAKKQKPAAPAPAAQPDDTPAPAAAPSPQQNNRLGLVATQKEWTKICQKDQSAREICYTTRDFSAEAGKPPVLALAVYDIKGDDTKLIRMLMPIGLLLRPGFRFVVDNGPTYVGAYELCIPSGCFAEAKVATALVDTMKSGTMMNVSVRGQGNNEVIFAVPLAGFGNAFDGPAIDPKLLQQQQQEQQQKLQAGLQKQAEDERKRLEAQKSGGNPTGGAAIPK